MSRFQPIGFVVTLAERGPQIAAAEAANATRGGTCPNAFAPIADEDMPTVRLPYLDLAHAPTMLEGGWSRPH